MNKRTNFITEEIKWSFFCFFIRAAINAGEIINPPKTAVQVEQEAQDRHEQYIHSHSSYFVGK